MALVVKDRVQETSTTTGTGTITLGGAVTGFQSFSVIGNGNTTYYTIAAGSEWEVGIGTYTLSGTTLSRDVVLDSSSSGSKVSFSAGTKNVYVSYPAGRASMSTGITENSSTISQNYTVTTGANAFSVGAISISSGVTVTVPSGSTWVIF